MRSSDVHVKSKTGVAVSKLENLTGNCFEHQKADYTVEGRLHRQNVGVYTLVLCFCQLC